MNDDFDVIAVARLFQEIPWNEFVLAVTMAVPIWEAHGDLANEQVRPLLAALTGGAFDPCMLTSAVDRRLVSPNPRDGKIERLYEQLHALTERSADNGPVDEARYQETLTGLRALQEAEADEMTAFADRRRQLADGAAEVAFARIGRLLGDHESPSA